MRIKIRDWDLHFERDRSKGWKNIKWVPVPNKQGLGYKKIMIDNGKPREKGAEIFGCWLALLQQGSIVNPRGDLTKYTIEELSMNTLIPLTILNNAINFLSQMLDWIEIIENLDKPLTSLDISAPVKLVDSSILSSSILSNSLKEGDCKGKKKRILLEPPTIEEVKAFFKENGFPESKAIEFHKYYSDGNPPWHDAHGSPVRSWKQKARVVWFKPENKTSTTKTDHPYEKLK